MSRTVDACYTCYVQCVLLRSFSVTSSCVSKNHHIHLASFFIRVTLTKYIASVGYFAVIVTGCEYCC